MNQAGEMDEYMQLPNPLISNLPGEDPRFIDLVGRVVVGEFDAKAALGLFIIRIDNWFDHRWLNFSGKGRVAYGPTGLPSYDPETALDEFHQEGTRTTFPPFCPNRVISQMFYRTGATSYALAEQGPWVHAAGKEHSSANLHRRITRHNNSSLFVWFSSQTLANRRGSLMVYRVSGDIVTSWYSSFSCGLNWQIDRIKGIPRQHLAGWLG